VLFNKGGNGGGGIGEKARRRGSDKHGGNGKKRARLPKGKVYERGISGNSEVHSGGHTYTKRKGGKIARNKAQRKKFQAKKGAKTKGGRRTSGAISTPLGEC